MLEKLQKEGTWISARRLTTSLAPFSIHGSIRASEVYLYFLNSYFRTVVLYKLIKLLGKYIMVF